MKGYHSARQNHILILQANVFPCNTPNGTLMYYFDIRQASSQRNQYVYQFFVKVP